MPRAKQNRLVPRKEAKGRRRSGDDLTPAMRQYLQQKADVPDAVLFFRMGDFYETFYDDAKVAARVLGLTLTARNKGDENPIPLAGIPYHALGGYLARMVKAGHKVAISEQVEDPKLAKGVVRREIVRIVTPGTLTDDALLDARSDNYLAAVCADGDRVGLAWVELAGGQFLCSLTTRERFVDELVRLSPAEILAPDHALDGEEDLTDRIAAAAPETPISRQPPHCFDAFQAERRLHEHFGVATLAGFGFDQMDASLRAAGALIDYLHQTQKTAVAHIQSIRRHVSDTYLQIDRNTWRSLEIDRTLREQDRAGALLGAIDRTLNPMGARLLRRWLAYPLCEAAPIIARHDAVAELITAGDIADELRGRVRDVADIERIVARVGVGRATPRDLAGLARSLARIKDLRQALEPLSSALLREAAQATTGLDELADLLARAIKPDPPLSSRDGGLIADGYDEQLDRYRSLQRDAQKWLVEFQAAESARTGIGTLKVGYNQVFGYYIEITHTHRERVPPDYIRKQTVKNAERYITPQLKEHEEEVLSAQEKANDLEHRLFEELCRQVGSRIAELATVAEAVARIDVLCGLARLAVERNYVRPTISANSIVEVRGGRHPVLEQTLRERFVPNDWHTGERDDRILLVTGPNMSGKSTYIRQNALLVILAQMGSFVPAESFAWGLVDRIFARVGSADDIARGQSTFMVEMTEAANILNNATPASLVVLDEIGRGTSTFDGLALAWAITEHLAREVGCRTLFATHYHELTELANLLDGVKNLNVAVREYADDVVFLHTIIDGAANKSYGVHVARLAGVPKAVVERSREVLAELEAGLNRETRSPRLTRRRTKTDQRLLDFPDPYADLADALRALDLATLSPLDALNRLSELKKKLRQ